MASKSKNCTGKPNSPVKMMRYSGRSAAVKPVPQRTCVACRQVRAKPELIRLVRTPEGNVEIDITGKKAGRGAYLCRRQECWEVGLKGNRLEHTLRSQLTGDTREQLVKWAKDLLKGAN